MGRGLLGAGSWARRALLLRPRLLQALDLRASLAQLQAEASKLPALQLELRRCQAAAQEARDLRAKLQQLGHGPALPSPHSTPAAAAAALASGPGPFSFGPSSAQQQQQTPKLQQPQPASSTGRAQPELPPSHPPPPAAMSPLQRRRLSLTSSAQLPDSLGRRVSKQLMLSPQPGGGQDGARVPAPPALSNGTPATQVRRRRRPVAVCVGRGVGGGWRPPPMGPALARSSASQLGASWGRGWARRAQQGLLLCAARPLQVPATPATQPGSAVAEFQDSVVRAQREQAALSGKVTSV
jgi:hypothetical protein